MIIIMVCHPKINSNHNNIYIHFVFGVAY